MMKQRNFVLIFGEKNSLADDLVTQLKAKEYKCIQAMKADEVEQVGRQFGRVAMLFFEHKFAVNFLKEADLSTFYKFRAVFFDKRPIMNPKIQWIFDEIFLKVYYPKIYEQFFSDLANFFSAENPDGPMDELEKLEFTQSSVQNPFLHKK